MNNQSLFVKIVIWFMVFLMSVGFAALVIAPFAGTSMFGGGGGREATEELVAEARQQVAKDDCADEDTKPTGAKLERCKEALAQLASAYTTLAQPDEVANPEEQELPRDYERNIERAGDAFERLYEIDPSDEDNAALYAGYLRDVGKPEQALDIWTELAKENPKNEDYLLQKAGAHQQTGDIEQAIATLRQYVRRFPDSGQIETIREEIKSLEEQQEQQAAGGAPGGAGGAPITVN